MLDPDFTLASPSPTANSFLFLAKGSQLWLPKPVTAMADLPRVADAPAADDLFYIGHLDKQYCFMSVQLTEQLAIDSTQWYSLRRLFPLFDETAFMMAGRALQLAHWLDENAYCGRCGSACQAHAQEFAMVCPACNFYQYPRINPCIIVLITRGDEALLAQGKGFPDGFFSCLAGFIEAGENAEQAVAREVLEEVNVEINNIRYQSSQAWAFPHSLMLGYRAEWQAGELTPQPSEIEKAAWFRRDALPNIPPAGSIAHDLIDSWLSG